MWKKKNNKKNLFFAQVLEFEKAVAHYCVKGPARRQRCHLEIAFTAAEIQPAKSKVFAGFAEVRQVRHEMK